MDLLSEVQFFGSKYIEFGSGSRILAQFGSGCYISIFKKSKKNQKNIISLKLKEKWY